MTKNEFNALYRQLEDKDVELQKLRDELARVNHELTFNIVTIRSLHRALNMATAEIRDTQLKTKQFSEIDWVKLAS